MHTIMDGRVGRYRGHRSAGKTGAYKGTLPPHVSARWAGWLAGTQSCAHAKSPGMKPQNIRMAPLKLARQPSEGPAALRDDIE